MRAIVTLACMLAAMATGDCVRAQPLAVDTRAPRYARAGDSPSDGPLPDAKDVAMPWLHGGSAGVAARINDALYLQVLSMLAPRTSGTTFTPASNDAVRGFCEIHFDVARNDASVLSIRMPALARGSAHCSDAGRSFHFDAATGRELSWADLLTGQGRDELIRRRDDAAIRAYERLLAALPPDPADTGSQDEVASPAPPPAATPAPAADSDFPGDEEQRAFFESCISHWEAAGPSLPLEFEFPQDGGLRLEFPACAGDDRRERMMDEPPKALAIPPADLESLLTAYGRRLLLGKGAAPAPADLFGQTLHGYVGKSRVTLHLGHPRGEKSEIEAFYAYDRIGKSIMLFGEQEAGALELREDAGQGFTLRQLGAVLTGTWHANGKSLPVRLE